MPARGLDRQRFFVLDQRNREMGYLISTETNNAGHIFSFDYFKDDSKVQCLMKCNCGWSSNIESFENSWSVIEAKVKASTHLSHLGIEVMDQICIFNFDTIETN
jgi:hypothetical protein